MQTSKLAEVLNCSTPTIAGRFKGISTDTRTIKKDNCFFAIKGPNFDGHNYITKALNAGAACAVVNKDYSGHLDETKILRVDDTIKALGQLAAHYRMTNDFKVIAVTGSAGKTTTRHIIAHVLSKHYRLFQSPKNFNNEIGLPITLLSADPTDEYIVAEIGANKPGEIEYLSNIAKPDIAIVTNIYPAHLEGFGSIENITIEKLSIVKGLKPDGIFLINADYPDLVNYAKSKNYNFNVFSISEFPEAASDHSAGCFSIDSVKVNVPLPGRGNLENAIAAWSVCKFVGISPQAFANDISDLKPVSMRTHTRNFGNITIIDDCYNANPASMKNALEILKHISTKQNARSVFVCGDMNELGNNSQQLHKELACDIVNADVDLLLTTGQMSKITASTVLERANNEITIETFDNTADLCDNLDKFVKDYDIVLVKGSRSAALDNAVRKLNELFE